MNNIKFIAAWFVLALVASGCKSLDHSAALGPSPSPAAVRYSKFLNRIDSGPGRVTQVSPNVALGVLQFNADGTLINPLEFDNLVNYVRGINNGPNYFNRVAIVSIGWGHDLSDSQNAYIDFLKGYFNSLSQEVPNITDRWLVLCISWPSGQGTLSQAIKTVLPSRAVATIIGKPLDWGLLPLTVWASAGLADTIGAGQLSDAVQFIVANDWDKPSGGHPEGLERPQIFLVGHSFGTRILTGAMGLYPVVDLHRRGFDTNSVDVYNFRTNVVGAVYIEPAMSVAEVEQIKGFPVFVTQSRHDHLNGAIYPVANIPYNFSSEAVIAWLEDLSSRDLSHVTSTNHSPLAFTPWAERVELESGAFIETPVYSALAFVFSPFSSIPLELSQSNHCYGLDSLAQLPLVQIPVEEMRRDTGVRSKGMLDFGQYFESASRIGIRVRERNLYDLLQAWRMNSLPDVYRRPIYVDCSEVINNSMLWSWIPHFNYQTNRLENYTLGWLDPIGSHTDYEHEAIYGLIYHVLGGEFKVIDSPGDATGQ